MQDDTYKFVSKHGGKISVLKTFLDVCPQPETVNELILSKKYNIEKYLHNLDGYAIEADTGGYFINGQNYKTEEEFKKAANDYRYSQKLEKIINE